MATNKHEQQQLVHLVRLAWDLHALGRTVAVELKPYQAAALVVERGGVPLRVRAYRRETWLRTEWWFGWGRSERVRALDESAVSVIAGAL